MIADIGKYYLYRHIRLDKDEPFYIGIGTKSNYYSYRYKRAFNRSQRSLLWKRVASKTEFNVDILIESSDYSFIKTKEVEFIKLYGRKDLGTGTLINLTDVGEGTLGRIVSIESQNKTVAAHKIRIRNRNTGIEYDSIKEAAVSVNVSYRKLSRHLNKALPSCEFEYVNQELNRDYVNTRNHKVINSVTGKIFYSITEAASFIGVSKTTFKYWLDTSKKDLEYKYLDKKVEYDNKKLRKVVKISTGQEFDSVKNAANFEGIDYSVFKK